MKRTILFLALATLLALGGQAFAEICTIDAVPAATLLIPNFKVDVDDTSCADNSGITTLFSINNASSASTLAHVTLWTDQSVPVLDFDVYLTGYDVQTINLKDIFCDGILPQTGPGTPGTGAVPGSNLGLFSDGQVDFPNCNNSSTPGGGPFWAVPIRDELIELLQEWFTGRPSSALGTCAGSGQKGDTTAIGYITVDQTTECSGLFPDDQEYYDPLTSPLGYDNILWGDYAIVDPSNAFAQGFGAVQIEAAPQGAIVDGENTFYGRYDLTLARNRREPLATTFAARYALAAPFDGTKLNIWREANGSGASYSCTLDGPASWWPLTFANDTGAGAVIAFNEQEDPLVIIPNPDPSNPLPPDVIGVSIPNEVNHCDINNGSAPFCDIPTGDFNYGWLYINLQEDSSEYGNDITSNYVTYTMAASGLYSAGFPGLALDSACNPIVTNPGFQF